MEQEYEQVKSLFVESLNRHQKLVNILNEYKDKNGISHISQPEIARLMNRSQTWVSKAIKRLNTEEVCIDTIGPGKYVVNYTNINARGVFSEILHLITECYITPELFYKSNSILAIERDISVKTIQMFRSYISTD